jgi:hypothetical protein
VARISTPRVLCVACRTAGQVSRPALMDFAIDQVTCRQAIDLIVRELRCYWSRAAILVCRPV